MVTSFEELHLHPELLQAVTESGYIQPTPIQAGAIPALLAGQDVLGQAQTGTGKTAAFALPMLQKLNMATPEVQGLVLTPTRELAMQVANTIYRYGQHLHARVLPIYGGQSYTRQIRRLTQGVHVVVGTPGRILDLMRQRVLNLSTVQYLVLDEADEMLRMGFIEDVEAILSETPASRQTALFSATLPPPIRRLTDRYMRDPQPITIQSATRTVAHTEQRYYMLEPESKVAALTRLLEVEDITSMLVFTQTKAEAGELAETLSTRGYSAEAIHGDLSQAARETALRRFRQGKAMVLVATNVAARGLDIEGVSHVVNHDVPDDVEEYVHRIGRTGRAGRPGIAITLATPRERRRLRDIEAFTHQPITRATLPPPTEVQRRRDERFKAALDARLSTSDLDREMTLVADLLEAGYNVTEIAAAAIQMARAEEARRPVEEVREVVEQPRRPAAPRPKALPTMHEPRQSGARAKAKANGNGTRPPRTRLPDREPGMVRLSLNVGRVHGIQPGDVVGAIANEAGIPGRGIGAIDIGKHRTFVDVQEAHVDRILRQMGRSTLRGQAMNLSIAE